MAWTSAQKEAVICGLHLNPTWFEILWSGPRFLVTTHGPGMFETVFAWMDDHRAYIPSRKLQAFQNVKNIVNTYIDYEIKMMGNTFRRTMR